MMGFTHIHCRKSWPAEMYANFVAFDAGADAREMR